MAAPAACEHRAWAYAQSGRRALMLSNPIPVACLVSLLSFGTAAAQAPTGVLKVVPSADVAELDPARASNQIGRIYSQMVFDTLFALDHTLSPRPMMVEHESISEDRLTYTFTLRSG